MCKFIGLQQLTIFTVRKLQTDVSKYRGAEGVGEALSIENNTPKPISAEQFGFKAIYLVRSVEKVKQVGFALWSMQTYNVY